MYSIFLSLIRATFLTFCLSYSFLVCLCPIFIFLTFVSTLFLISLQYCFAFWSLSTWGALIRLCISSFIILSYSCGQVWFMGSSGVFVSPWWQVAVNALASTNPRDVSKSAVTLPIIVPAARRSIDVVMGEAVVVTFRVTAFVFSGLQWTDSRTSFLTTLTDEIHSK